MDLLLFVGKADLKKENFMLETIQLCNCRAEMNTQELLQVYLEIFRCKIDLINYLNDFSRKRKSFYVWIK
jgi:hypothetical protein